MKKNRLSFYAMGAALALTAASCTNDMPVEEVYDGPVETNYLSVNIVTSRETGTRAPNEEIEDPVYENGLATENKVGKVRFYFFDADGNATDVKNSTGGMTNYYDWTPTSQGTSQTAGAQGPNTDDPEDSYNVEKVLNATIIISTKAGDGLPASVVAVINPPTSLDSESIGSIDELNGVTSAYAATADNFVMTNSVYSNGQTPASVMEAVDVRANIRDSESEALQNPAKIYVERVNAKARLTSALTEVTIGDNQPAYATGIRNAQYVASGDEPGAVDDDDDDDAPAPIPQEEQIYVRFKGWNVTATSDKSYLMKHIDTDWDNEDLFGYYDIDWNSPTRFRSFWAINPSGVTPQYGDFSAAQAIQGFSAGATNYTYMQENAAPSTNPLAGPTTPTQIIIAAQLCNWQGEDLTVCEYASKQYSYLGLQTLYAQNSNVYRVIPGDGTTQTSYTKITPAEITFITATEAGKASPTVEGRYYVYAKIDPKEIEGQPGQYYSYCIGDAQGTEANTAAANASLIDLGHAKIWETGMTYYYFDIRHLGVSETTTSVEDGEQVNYSPGYYGVVRNHIYDATINTLTGLGTPVYDPTETIYPEKPNSSDLYIGAEINILTWRVVASGVDLAW